MVKKKKNNGGLMSRSNIPYVQRLAMRKRNNIMIEREYSAKITMFCMSIAMNEIEGIGYKRLVQFSLHFKKNVDEFYADPEMGYAHAKTRIEQIGMPFSIAEDGQSGESSNESALSHAQEAAQIALICGAITMNEEFGFGKERQARIASRVTELTQRYKQEGIKFLLDGMEKIGFAIVNGTAIAYMDDDGNAITPNKAKKEGFEWND